MRRLTAGILALFLLFVLTACGEQLGTETQSAEETQSGEETLSAEPEAKSPVEGKAVALIPRDANDPFYEAANAGAQGYAAQWGLQILYLQDAGNDAAAQAEAVRQAVEQGVDGICIAALDAPEVSEALRQAAAAGVCVTTWDSDAEPDARALMVSQGTAAVMGSMLVEMGAASLKDRAVDPTGEVHYLWHGDGEESAENASWYAAVKDYIRQNYPAWVELDAPYASEQDAGQTGETLLENYGDVVDLILCGTAEALKGQCLAAQNRGLSAANVTITGFCAPSEMRQYLDAGVCTRWGLWDCGMQSAMGCYLAAWLSEGNEVRVGDVVNIPRIGSVEILANSELLPEQPTAGVNNGVVLLPERIVFTAENINDYSF